jgi:glycosyltransferase involved in cell wall biosynthesis
MLQPPRRQVEPVKILHVLADLAPETGGPAKAGFEMARAVARRGHEVTIFATNHAPHGRARAPAGETVRRDGVAIRLFPVNRPRAWLTSWPMAAALWRMIPTVEVVHIHSLYLFHDFAAGDISRHFAKPYLVRPHGTLDPYIYRRHRWKKAIMERLFQDRVIADAARIHFTTEEEMNLAAPFIHGVPGVVVPNGLDTEEYRHLPAKGGFRRAHPEIGDRRIVLFLGRLNFKKGLDVLVPAFARALADVPELHLVIAGPDGGMGTALDRLIAAHSLEGRITRPGMVEGAAKLALLSDAELFVLPSYSENFGIAVIEAMAAGLPVLISSKVNIWREVTEDGAGLAEPPEIDAFARSMAELMAHPERRAIMGGAGRASVSARYEWSAVAARLEAVYAAVAEAP